MDSSNKKLVSHASIYFTGNLLRRVASFIMLPIYTRFLTTADYGTIELLGTVLDFIGIIVGMRIAQAIFRFYSAYEAPFEKNEVITTSLLLVALLNMLGVMFIYFFSSSIANVVLGSEEYAGLLVLFSFTLLGAAFIEIPMVYLRAIQKPWVFVLFSTLKLVSQLGLNIYFIVFLKMRVEGVIYSAVLSTAFLSAILLIYTLRKTGCRFSIKKAKEITSFSWPLIVTSIIAFYITFGDRYFLQFYRDLSDVGIYALGYKFGFLLGFVVGAPFFSIWDSERYNVLKKSNAKEIYHDVLLVFSLLLVLFVGIISIMSKDILRVMADPSFWPAYKLIPIILAAYAFNALTDYTMMGILLKKRTRLLIYGNFITAVVITGAYWFLIPRMGPMGAAIATLIAFFVRFIWITNASQKLYRLKIPWTQIALLSIVGIFYYGLSLIGPEELIVSIVFNSLLSVLFFASALFFPILPSAWRKHLVKAMQHPNQIFGHLRSIRN